MRAKRRYLRHEATGWRAKFYPTPYVCIQGKRVPCRSKFFADTKWGADAKRRAIAWLRIQR